MMMMSLLTGSQQIRSEKVIYLGISSMEIPFQPMVNLVAVVLNPVV
jgi:hypothetical protein